jgi:hypothetical protein
VRDSTGQYEARWGFKATSVIGDWEGADATAVAQMYDLYSREVIGPQADMWVRCTLNSSQQSCDPRIPSLSWFDNVSGDPDYAM